MRRRSKVNPEAHTALTEAKENLRRVEDRSQEVTELVESLKELKRHNHFAERLMTIMGGVQT